jgi:hypothetical protein
MRKYIVVQFQVELCMLEDIISQYGQEILRGINDTVHKSIFEKKMLVLVKLRRQDQIAGNSLES